MLFSGFCQITLSSNTGMEGHARNKIFRFILFPIFFFILRCFFPSCHKRLAGCEGVPPYSRGITPMAGGGGIVWKVEKSTLCPFGQFFLCVSEMTALIRLVYV